MYMMCQCCGVNKKVRANKASPFVERLRGTGVQASAVCRLVCRLCKEFVAYGGMKVCEVHGHAVGILSTNCLM